MTKKAIKYIHEGLYVAEVEIELVDSDSGWSPTMSLRDALKLDEIRAYLHVGNLVAAVKYATVYEMRKIAA